MLSVVRVNIFIAFIRVFFFFTYSISFDPTIFLAPNLANKREKHIFFFFFSNRGKKSYIRPTLTARPAKVRGIYAATMMMSIHFHFFHYCFGVHGSRCFGRRKERGENFIVQGAWCFFSCVRCGTFKMLFVEMAKLLLCEVASWEIDH